MIWRVRTNNITLDEIYNLEPLETFTAEEPAPGMCNCIDVELILSIHL